MDCGVHVNKIIFSDSLISRKMSCGKTKASALALNVLAPFSIENHLKYLTENNLKYSISNDASNKCDKKMFPLSIQYFHVENAMTNFILDFCESAEENSEKIYKEITERLANNGLKINNLVAFGADNASINYGVHQSVYVNLTYENDSIIKANCLCHVIHNCAK